MEETALRLIGDAMTLTEEQRDMTRQDKSTQNERKPVLRSSMIARH